MNCFAGFPRATVGGFHAVLRLARDGEAKPIVGENGHAVVYPTSEAAWQAVTHHLLAYFNGHYRRDGDRLTAAFAEAERVFGATGPSQYFPGRGRAPVTIETKKRRVRV